jgi:transposase
LLYQYCYKVKSKEELTKVLSDSQKYSVFIEVLVRRGARKDLGRPNYKFIMRFMSFRANKPIVEFSLVAYPKELD